MKRYFNEEYQTLNDEGRRVITEVDKILKPIVKREYGTNFDLHELHSIICMSAITVVSETILLEGALASKRNRRKEGK